MSQNRNYQTSYRDPYDWHHTPLAETELATALAPLCGRLARIEGLQGQLLTTSANAGERASQLEVLAELLERPVVLAAPQRIGDTVLRLTDPRSVEDALERLAPRLHLNTRTDPRSGLPSFLLFRIATSWLAEYSSLVEEYFRSERYPMDDPRFLKARVYGRERWYLRLSPLRHAAATHLAQQDAASMSVDTLLNDLAADVLQASWHDTQRVAVLLAEGLHVPNLRLAVELVYFANTAEPAQIRRLAPTHIDFLRKWINPLLARFIEASQGVSARDFLAAREQARDSYRRLQRAFGRFMAIEVPWGQAGAKMRLSFVIHGNFRRLPLVIPMLRDMDPVTRGAARLDAETSALDQDLLELVGAEAGPTR